MKNVEEIIGRAVQQDIPLTRRPFAAIGGEAGVREAEVVRTLRDLLKRGVIRKFGAILRHQKAGFNRNVMVLWAIPEGKTEEAGRILSSFKEVTHCYERTPAFEGKYNVFTMVHFQDRDPEGEIRRLAGAAGIEDFKVLESVEEFKKSSMDYF